MAEHATVIRIAHWQPAPGKRDELAARLEGGAADVRAMEGCFGIQVCAVRERPDVIAVVSRWASQAAFDNFLKAMADRQANVIRELAAGPPTTEHLTPI